MSFRVWAPSAQTVELDLDGQRHKMEREGEWWATDVPAAHGTPYGYVLDGEGPFPDPRGMGYVYEHDRFLWTDGDWRRPQPGGVIYELHIGTFTEEGTFDAAIQHLDHLVDLGVDYVELMPVAAFPGHHGWGYDGVRPWAVHEPYGGPDGLKRFVNACHAMGLGVLLDVVYNHLGPSGNYLPRFGPYFTDVYKTPWGQAINLDQAGSDEVRDYLLENAAMWVRDFHMDGLRLDAVHAFHDSRACTLLEELAALDGYIIAESDLNDPRLVTPPEAGGLGLDASWNDDLHHALHAALTGERQAYYADFGSMAAIAKALTEVYFHNGTWSSFRRRSHGRPVDPRLPRSRFVVSLQNHDQVGNRAAGDRLPAYALTLGAPLVLLSPYTPLIFMGEEWAAGTPWCYFTDHQEPELGRAVTEGRRREHGHAEEVPDPQDPTTYARSILDRDEVNLATVGWYRALIALRQTPNLAEPDVTFDEEKRWLVMDRGALRVAVNFGPEEVRLPAGTIRLASSDEVEVDGDELVLPGSSVAVLTSG